MCEKSHATHQVEEVWRTVKANITRFVKYNTSFLLLYYYYTNIF